MHAISSHVVKMVWHDTEVAGGCADAPRLRIHSGSVLFRTRPQWLLFWKVQQGTKGWYDMQDLLAVDPQWLPEAAPHMFRMTRAPA